MTRSPDPAPSQSADLIAEAEAALEELEFCAEWVRREAWVIFTPKLITALRAAEAENAELTAFRNGYKDTIRRLQDSVSAAVAREKVLRIELEHIVRECDALNKGPVAVSIARRALGGGNNEGTDDPKE